MDDGGTTSYLRVDTPAKIRARARRSREGTYGVVGCVSVLAMVAGIGGAAMLLLGGFRLTDYLGAALLALWVVVWWRVLAGAIGAERSIRQWRITPRVGQIWIGPAHAAYEKLSPDTRANYGRALVARIYDLSQTDVRGKTAMRQVEHRIMDRVKALEGLVDAEDKLRLYAVDRDLVDRDDVDAAALWQQAVEQADRYLRDPEL